MINNCIRITLIVLVLFSCQRKGDIAYSKYHTEEGLAAEGSFLHDTIKIGTHRTYYSNGSVKIINNYDSIGVLTGEFSLYYENGKLWQKMKYVKDSLSGPFFEYFPNGSLKTRAHYLLNKRVGDVFFYNENGYVENYNFIDMYDSNLIYAEYSGNKSLSVLEGAGQFMEDSISFSSENDQVVNLIILLAHIPYCNTKIKIQELNEGGKILYEFLISNTNNQIITQTVPITDSIKTFRVVGSQYDSILNKTRTIISDHKISY